MEMSLLMRFHGFRIGANVRQPSQDYFVVNDIGFTIESGETDYQQQDLGEIILITQDGHPLATQGEFLGFITQDYAQLIFQNGNYCVSQQVSQRHRSIIDCTTTCKYGI